jgi:hypothetical protein
MVMNFLLNNFTAIAVSLTALVACFSFVFSVIQWRDSRKRELDNQKYLQYREVIRTISGSVKQEIHPPEQIVCVRLLLEFEGYYETTLRIFSNEVILTMFNENWRRNIMPEMREVLKEIKERQSST